MKHSKKICQVYWFPLYKVATSFLRLFNYNSFKENPGKFQFLILGKSLWPKDCLAIQSIDFKAIVNLFSYEKSDLFSM